jgi:hypothetical protein
MGHSTLELTERTYNHSRPAHEAAAKLAPSTGERTAFGLAMMPM